MQIRFIQVVLLVPCFLTANFALACGVNNKSTKRAKSQKQSEMTLANGESQNVDERWEKVKKRMKQSKGDVAKSQN